MSNCRGGIGPSAVSQLSSSELLSITRDATQFFGQRGRFRSASEAQAYRKMLTIGAGVNGSRPVASAVIATVQAAVRPCRLGRSLIMRRSVPEQVIIQEQGPAIAEVHVNEQEQEQGLAMMEIQEDEYTEEVEVPVEDLSIELVPIPAVPDDVAREARLDALWELQTYAAPAPKITTGPSFGGSSGSGDIAAGLSVPTSVKPFLQMNPMRASGPTA
jgi:hypothetical protein